MRGAAAGLYPETEEAKHRLYFDASSNIASPVRVLLLRGEDIPRWLASDDVQIGIVSSDYVIEHTPEGLIPFFDTGWCRGHLCLMSRADDDMRDRYDFKEGDSIYSQYPKAARTMLEQSGLTNLVKLVEIQGAAEAYYFLRPDCRATVDIVARGDAMRANGLRIVEKLWPTSAMLYSNAESYLNPKVNRLGYAFAERARTVSEDTLNDVLRANATESPNQPGKVMATSARSAPTHCSPAR